MYLFYALCVEITKTGTDFAHVCNCTWWLFLGCTSFQVEVAKTSPNKMLHDRLFLSVSVTSFMKLFMFKREDLNLHTAKNIGKLMYVYL